MATIYTQGENGRLIEHGNVTKDKIIEALGYVPANAAGQVSADKLVTTSGTPMRLFIGSEAQYEALSDNKNMIAITTDDPSATEFDTLKQTVNAIPSTYAKKIDVDNTYAKAVDVANTYAKSVDVANTYAKAVDVSNTYAKATTLNDVQTSVSALQSTVALLQDAVSKTSGLELYLHTYRLNFTTVNNGGGEQLGEPHGYADLEILSTKNTFIVEESSNFSITNVSNLLSSNCIFRLTGSISAIDNGKTYSVRNLHVGVSTIDSATKTLSVSYNKDYTQYATNYGYTFDPLGPYDFARFKITYRKITRVI